MRTFFTLIIFFLFLTFSEKANGQYFQFSQTSFSEQRINPAFVAISDYAKVEGLYRRQQAAEDFMIQTSMLSARLPFLKSNGGERWSGLGLTLLDDRSGMNGIFKVQEIGVSYAMRVRLAATQSLYFGIKGGYEIRQFSLNGLFTGSQYIPGRGFNTSLGSGETPDDFKQQFFTLASGLIWENTNRSGELISRFGLSMVDLNKVDHAFFNGETVAPMSAVMHGRLHLTGPTAFYLDPVAMVTAGGGNSAVNLGAIWGYGLNENKDRIELISRYIFGKYGILGIQFERENFALGFSYDIPLGAQNANRGAIEFGIAIKKLRLSKNRKPKIDDKEENRVPVIPKKEPKRDSVMVKPETEVIDKADSSVNNEIKGEEVTESEDNEEKTEADAKAGDLLFHPFDKEASVNLFYFNFNSVTLNDEAEEYIQGLADLLNDNPNLKVSLTGHTDNIGTDDYNRKLSLARANRVRDLLVRKQVDASRITVQARGEVEPLESNETENGRAANRRVEIVIE